MMITQQNPLVYEFDPLWLLKPASLLVTLILKGIQCEKQTSSSSRNMAFTGV